MGKWLPLHVRIKVKLKYYKNDPLYCCFDLYADIKANPDGGS